MFRFIMAVFTVLVLALLPGCGLGPFTDQQDIGKASTVGAGSASWAAGGDTLRVTGGGANVWAKEDNMHFVWKKVSGGNLTLAADVAFDKATPGAIDHRKAMLMIRQSLDPGSAYADACLHGNGMAALQWRDGPGENSYEIIANADTPKRLRIEKRGNYFSTAIGNSEADMHPAGGACKVELTGDYYVGVGVCSHSAERLETASFSNMELGVPPAGATRVMISTLEVYMDSGNRDRRAVYVEAHTNGARMEAPNWLHDNTNTLMYNYGGRLYKVPAVLPSADPTNVKITPELVDIGDLRGLNNDHVLSFDGKMLGVSGGSGGSAVYTLPMYTANPTATRITPNAPSYFHGWSPDGKTLVFAAPRNPNASSSNWDIYSIPATGGTETRLTTDPAREDGPEYSPDGQYVYFNSARSGKMQIWRMKPDGSNQEQVTHDDYNNWFPHLSPNGQKMVFISYPTTLRADDHDSITDVQIRLMTLSSGAIVTVAKIYGGQGTINVPSWSPDGRYFAFMSYQAVTQ
jgi:TolB protein